MTLLLRLWFPVRLWLWQHGGERVAAVALFLLGHGLHWRERHAWLNNHGPVQALQRGTAIIALIVGVAYTITGKGQAASPLADLLDSSGLHPLLWPHQWFGLALSVSSILLIVAVYEWPVESEWSVDSPASKKMTDSRLRVLLKMQLTGHMMALIYWGMTGLILVADSHFSAGGWGSLAYCGLHRHLYIRNNREFERDRADIRRARVKAKEDRKESKSGLLNPFHQPNEGTAVRL